MDGEVCRHEVQKLKAVVVKDEDTGKMRMGRVLICARCQKTLATK